MKTTFQLVILLLTCQLHAQVFTQGAKSIALGGTQSLFKDEQSLFGNQAGLGAVKQVSVMTAAQRRFMLAELDAVAAGMVLPTQSGTFGLLVQHYGFEDFRQQKVGLAYARRLLEHFYAGASFDYYHTSIPEYGSSGNVSVQAGLMAQLSNQVTIGAHVVNPADVKISEEDALPTIFTLGLSWAPSLKTSLFGEIVKEISFPVRARLGMEYRAATPLFFRLGFATQPSTVHFGLGLFFNEKMKIDIASSYHQVLGFTPSVGIGYSWGKT